MHLIIVNIIAKRKMHFHNLLLVFGRDLEHASALCASNNNF